MSASPICAPERCRSGSSDTPVIPLPHQKLGLDFTARPRMGVVMAEPAHPGVVQMVELLLLEAGRIMEDASVDLAQALPADPRSLDRRIVDLAAAASVIGALAAAAQTLQRMRDRLPAD